MRNLRIGALVLMLITAVVAGCGGGSQPGTTMARPESSAAKETAPAAAAPKELTKLKLGVGGTKNSMIFLVPVFAQANKFFEEEGLDVEIIEFQGGAQAAQALVSGDVDVASMATDHAVKSKVQGVDVSMVALHTRYPTVTLIVDSKLKDKVKTVKDLKGMKVGITSPGSGSHKALLSLLDKFGLKPTDVEIVGVGTSGMPAALESGKIQAAANYDPFVTQVVSSGKAFVLWDLRTKKDTFELYGGEYPFVSLVTRTESVDKKADTIQKVVRAIVKAQKFLTSNPAETITAKLPTEIKGSDEALYLAALRANLEAITPDGQASDQGLQLVINSLKADGVIPAASDVKPSAFWNGRFLGK
ncbi:MAG TPA: ABC transporter substrate-binding protein [Symbiobacteriaceae bacterium]|nr:ABC transporter substrate-binding protein [Symbiobacteriaceae bacterium]